MIRFRKKQNIKLPVKICVLLFVSFASNSFTVNFFPIFSTVNTQTEFNMIIYVQSVVSASLKAGFYTCVSRTHNGAQCLSIDGHQWSQAISAFAVKACVLATKSNMLNFCEGMWGLCWDMLWLWPVGADNAGRKKIFCLKAQNQKYNYDQEARYDS